MTGRIVMACIVVVVLLLVRSNNNNNRHNEDNVVEGKRWQFIVCANMCEGMIVATTALY